MKNIRSKGMLKAAQGQSCVRCSRPADGTVVAAHYQGQRSALYGKGKGIKPHDLCIADLCRGCHAEMDRYLNSSDWGYRSEEFLHCVLLTLIRRVRQGVLVLPP